MVNKWFNKDRFDWVELILLFNRNGLRWKDKNNILTLRKRERREGRVEGINI